jgi:hypothetical protein
MCASLDLASRNLFSDILNIFPGEAHVSAFLELSWTRLNLVSIFFFCSLAVAALGLASSVA